MNIKKTPYNWRLKKYQAFLYYRQWWIKWGLCESHARVKAYHTAFKCYRAARIDGSNPTIYSGV
jgi:hypothetical protein